MTVEDYNDYYADYEDGYSDDYPDECAGGSYAVKDLANNTMSIHNKFKEIEELSNDENWKHGKRCCADHSYVFQDLCEVYLR